MANGAEPSLFDRTLINLRRMWRDLAGPPGGDVDPDLGADAADDLRRRFEDCLVARGGEVSARTRAADLGRLYLGLSQQGRRRYLAVLGSFGIDRPALAETARQFAADPDDAGAEAALRKALTAPRRRLLTQFTSLPQGVKFLVDLRADLLAAADADPALLPLEADLRDLLAAWFDVGFLDLVRLSWDSPASLLEKLIAYEAVHAIRGWEDLHHRLERDRRVYAFFHPRMPGEPVIFVQVALVDGIAGSVQGLLDRGRVALDPRAADTAIFYSISNAQAGLRGIGFGNFLIKQVVDALLREFPRIQTFATLSPMPGFRRWLDRLPDDDLTRIAKGGADLRTQLAEAPWGEDPDAAQDLREPLLRLGAWYLAKASRNDRPVDPVARFHLGNGASIDRLNWLADRSPKGLAESFGLMVNYRYRLEDIEDNHEAFAASGAIAASDAIRALLAPRREGRRRFLAG